MSESSSVLVAQAAESSRLRRACARLAVLYDEAVLERDASRQRLAQMQAQHEAAMFEAERLREEVCRLRGPTDSIGSIEDDAERRRKEAP